MNHMEHMQVIDDHCPKGTEMDFYIFLDGGFHDHGGTLSWFMVENRWTSYDKKRMMTGGSPISGNLHIESYGTHMGFS